MILKVDSKFKNKRKEIDKTQNSPILIKTESKWI